MTNETYKILKDIQGNGDTSRGYFANATGKEVVYYQMPEKAELFMQPSNELAKWVSDAGIKGVIKILPESTRIEHYPDALPHEVIVDCFPPEGAGYIYQNGDTLPLNLADLVRDRIESGWTATNELLTLLNLASAN